MDSIGMDCVIVGWVALHWIDRIGMDYIALGWIAFLDGLHCVGMDYIALQWIALYWDGSHCFGMGDGLDGDRLHWIRMD